MTLKDAASLLIFTPSREYIGQQAENRFQDWMDAHQISYVRIDQEPNTLALAFRGIVRRPDFFIHIGSLNATIAIDVKSRRFDERYENFIVNEDDIQLLRAFQQQFGNPVWLVLSTTAIQHNTWYWIQLDQVISDIKPKTSSVKGNQFRPIRIDQCKTVAIQDGIGRIFF
ncbi:MAG TPA: hypothetical protein VKM55_13805 [Candidatus Lokiarchaeia archaeon]|nr:hypothetical protein [Candidatus Lokiarchaeia archaeon]